MLSNHAEQRLQCSCPALPDFLEHTSELGGALGGVASFGRDAAGEMYLLTFNGRLLKIVPAAGSHRSPRRGSNRRARHGCGDSQIVAYPMEVQVPVEDSYERWRHTYRTVDWEEAYASGRWDYLADIGELPRYGIVAEYLHKLIGRGRLLDAGCGEAIPVDYLDVGRFDTPGSTCPDRHWSCAFPPSWRHGVRRQH